MILWRCLRRRVSLSRLVGVGKRCQGLRLLLWLLLDDTPLLLLVVDHKGGFCHGPEGRGDQAPRLVPLAYEVDYILAIVREGYGEMPPISTRELNDEQVRLVVEYLEILTHDPEREQAKAEPVLVPERP